MRTIMEWRRRRTIRRGAGEEREVMGRRREVDREEEMWESQALHNCCAPCQGYLSSERSLNAPGRKNCFA
eukprot:4869463-Pyramimonas_sp.AAC.1